MAAMDPSMTNPDLPMTNPSSPDLLQRFSAIVHRNDVPLNNVWTDECLNQCSSFTSRPFSDQFLFHIDFQSAQFKVVLEGLTEHAKNTMYTLISKHRTGFNIKDVKLLFEARTIFSRYLSLGQNLDLTVLDPDLNVHHYQVCLCADFTQVVPMVLMLLKTPSSEPPPISSPCHGPRHSVIELNHTAVYGLITYLKEPGTLIPYLAGFLDYLSQNKGLLPSRFNHLPRHAVIEMEWRKNDVELIAWFQQALDDRDLYLRGDVGLWIMAFKHGDLILSEDHPGQMDYAFPVLLQRLRKLKL